MAISARIWSPLTRLLNRARIASNSSRVIRSALGDLLEPDPPHLGTGRDAQPIGLVLEDQCIDDVPVLQSAERGLPQVRVQHRDELVGVASLHRHLVEGALVDRLPVQRDDRLIAPGVAGTQQFRQAVGDHEAEHGQDREDGEQLALMATKDLKRHGVPRVSIVASGGSATGTKDRPESAGRGGVSGAPP